METRAVSRLCLEYFGRETVDADAIDRMVDFPMATVNRILSSGCLRVADLTDPACTRALARLANKAIDEWYSDTPLRVFRLIDIEKVEPAELCHWMMALVTHNYSETFRYLMNAGVAAKKLQPGHDPLFVPMLRAALMHGTNYDTVRELVKHVALEDHDDLVPLAVLARSFANVSVLLTAGAKFPTTPDIQAQDFEGTMSYAINRLSWSLLMPMLTLLARHDMDFTMLDPTVVTNTVIGMRFGEAMFLVDHGAPFRKEVVLLSALHAGAPVDLVRKLVERGATTPVTDSFEFGPLYIAIVRHPIELVELLLDETDSASTATPDDITKALMDGATDRPNNWEYVSLFADRGFSFVYPPGRCICGRRGSVAAAWEAMLAKGAAAPTSRQCSDPNVCAADFRNGGPLTSWGIGGAHLDIRREREALYEAVIDHVGEDVAQLIADCVAIPHGRRRKIYEAEREEIRVGLAAEYAAKRRRRL